MAKSTVRIIRDIVLIVVAIGVAIFVYTYLKTPNADLEHDIQLGQGDSPQGTSPMQMGHGTNLFSEDDQSMIAVALGDEITLGALHKEANQLFRRMGLGNDHEMVENEMFLEGLKAEALAEIFTDLLIFEKAAEAGIDVEAKIDEALVEWAEGYDSPEAKLASMPESMGVTVERMRSLFLGEMMPGLLSSALEAETKGMTEEEQREHAGKWLTDRLIEIKVDFKDEKLAQSWGDYVDELKNPDAGEMSPHGGGETTAPA